MICLILRDVTVSLPHTNYASTSFKVCLVLTVDRVSRSLKGFLTMTSPRVRHGVARMWIVWRHVLSAESADIFGRKLRYDLAGTGILLSVGTLYITALTVKQWEWTAKGLGEIGYVRMRCDGMRKLSQWVHESGPYPCIPSFNVISDHSEDASVLSIALKGRRVTCS